MTSQSNSESVYKTTLPVVVGYIPVAITFGLIANQQGFSFLSVLAFSVFVFAGASQFIGLTLLSTSAISYTQLFVTIWLINSRHLVLSLAYLPHVKNWTLAEKLRFFPLLTDESFAVLSNSQTLRHNPKRAWHLSVINYLAWILGTVIGYWFGTFIPDPKIFGLDFGLIGLFIGIIVLFIKDLSHLITFLSSVILTVVFYYVFNSGRNAIIIAALIASFIGWLWEQKKS